MKKIDFHIHTVLTVSDSDFVLRYNQKLWMRKKMSVSS